GSRALTLIPDGYPYLPSLLVNLGASWSDRFERLGELVDLEKAIEYESRAVALTPGDHLELPARLMNLGTSYNYRFKRLNELIDFQKSVECKNRALVLTPNDHPDLPSRLVSLGVSYRDHFKRLGEPGDLEKAIECDSLALTLTPDDHPDLSSWQINLTASHSMRFYLLGEVDDISKAVEYMSMALKMLPGNHPHLPTLYLNLGPSHSGRFQHLGQPDDLKEAIKYASHTLALTPNGHPDLSPRHLCMARFQFRYSRSTGDPSLMQDSLSSFRKASQSPIGAPNDKSTAALDWAAHASEHSLLNCIEAYQTAIDLLPQFIRLGATTNQRYLDLGKAKNLAVSAAFAAICSSKYKLALEWLEHARCVVWNQNVMLRSPLDQLQPSYPKIAVRLQTVAKQLYEAGSKSQELRELSSDGITPEQAAQQHRRLAEEYNDLISEARKLPRFGDFLEPEKAAGLMRAARNGPIIVINCHTDRCDALLILPKQDKVTHLPLPNFTGEKALRARNEMVASLRRKGFRSRGFKIRQEPGAKRDIESVLATLWNDVVRPVLDFLGYTNDKPRGSLPHVIWCPTGALSFLPLHAARDYSQPGSKVLVFDYVISSYTPTLTALLSSTPSLLNHDRRVLAIGQTNTPGCSSLPGTAEELACIKAHTQNKARYSQFLDDQATKIAVLDAMEQHDWDHLACHAHQNVEDPTKSGFYLHDGTLDLASISQRSFKNKGLAFLSACQTATGDENLPDEAIHLASGMFTAGYTGVIATMWSVKDADAPFVADKVYAQLMADGKLGNGEAGKRYIMLLQNCATRSERRSLVVGYPTSISA
ncbi:hypothetical protein FRC11_010453, partial [Ceratobasidium sp. 423]